MFIELVVPSNPLILGHPLVLLLSIFPRIKVFLVNWFFTSGGQSIGIFAFLGRFITRYSILFDAMVNGIVSLSSLSDLSLLMFRNVRESVY